MVSNFKGFGRTSTDSVHGPRLTLENGSRVAVIGGGPAGSFYSYFLLQQANRVDIDVHVDIYERRDFSVSGPTGCNMCAGVISESLIQALSIEGINLPEDVVQRGIHSFVLHTNKQAVTMHASFFERRIATVYRGGGPLGSHDSQWKSFDNHLLQLALSSGASLVQGRVSDIIWNEERPQIHIDGQEPRIYDLVVGAVGVNSPSMTLFENLGIGYKRPNVKKTANVELALGAEFVRENLGSSMHVFLLDIPKLDFAAVIPKGEYGTLCLIGENIDSKFVEKFLQEPSVQECLKGKTDREVAVCRCAPLASLGDAVHPFGDRVVLIGDCGVNRLNKDGIGSAYRVAKAAVVTSVFRGISSNDFEEGYQPLCKSIRSDNRFGKLIFVIVGIIKSVPFLTSGVMRMAGNEQHKRGNLRYMSMVLWDMFTGSAPYRATFWRCLKLPFIGQLLWNITFKSNLVAATNSGEELMETETLGKVFQDGDVIVRQGDVGDCMYVIQSGEVEVIQEKDGQRVVLAVLGKDDIFGEMALFNKEVRTSTVRALGTVRALTVDKRIFLRRVHEDPSFAFIIMRKLSQRVSDLNTELIRNKA